MPPSHDNELRACLEKQLADRPASCGELGRALRALELTPTWTQEDARAWWEEHQPERRRDESTGDDVAAVTSNAADVRLLTKAV